MSEFAALTRSVGSVAHHLHVGGVCVGCAERLEDAARGNALSQLQHDDAAHVSREQDQLYI